MKIKHPKNLSEIIKNNSWSKKHKTEALDILSRHKKHKAVEFSERYFIYIALFVMLLGNIILSIALIPVILILDGIILYSILILLSLSFGFWSYYIFEDYELKAHHHILSKVFLPSLLFVAVFLSTLFSNWLSLSLNTYSSKNPLYIGLVFLVAFIVPIIFIELYYFFKSR